MDLFLTKLMIFLMAVVPYLAIAAVVVVAVWCIRHWKK